MEIRTSAKAYLWDSLLSGNQTTGDWLAERATHRELVDNSHRLWECLFPDESPIFGAWVRGHSGVPGNDLVDAYAKALARGGAEPQTSLRHLGPRQYSLQDVLRRLQTCDAFERPVHNHSSSAECLHSGLCRVNAEVIAELKPSLPKAQPRRPWVKVDCLHLIDERSAALRSGDESRAAEITTELSRQCRRAKKAFFKKR